MQWVLPAQSSQSPPSTIVLVSQMPPHSRLGGSYPGPLRTLKECSKAGGQLACLLLGSTPEPCLCPSFCSRVPRGYLLRARGSYWWGQGVCDFPHPLGTTVLVILGELLAWSWWRPGVPLSSPQWPGQPQPRKQLVPSVHSDQGAETPAWI